MPFRYNHKPQILATQSESYQQSGIEKKNPKLSDLDQVEKSAWEEKTPNLEVLEIFLS